MIFLVIDEPSVTAEITMQRLLNMFGKLNIPLALHKSVEPTTLTNHVLYMCVGQEIHIINP
jgi:hypothetical protein